MKARKERKPNYLKTVIIVHGKSEKRICDFIQSNTKINWRVESNQNGRKPIQIGTSLNKILSSMKFKSLGGFKKEFIIEIVIDENKKEVPHSDFKIFIIMDTDDCAPKDKQDFYSGSMFKDHWLAEYIILIYNNPDLEEVCAKAGIKFKNKGSERKKEYTQLFQLAGGEKEFVQLKKFRDGLKKCNDTNMDLLIDFCLKASEQNTISKKTK